MSPPLAVAGLPGAAAPGSFHLRGVAVAENTGIEWCDHTFNPWVGCTKISPACDHCYAEAWAKRDDEPDVFRIGRRRAGRLLDGRTWNEFPRRAVGC